MKRTPATSAIGRGGGKNMLVRCVVKIEISGLESKNKKLILLYFF